MNSDDLFREGSTSPNHAICIDDAGPSSTPEAACVELSLPTPHVTKPTVPVHFYCSSDDSDYECDCSSDLYHEYSSTCSESESSQHSEGEDEISMLTLKEEAIILQGEANDDIIITHLLSIQEAVADLKQEVKTIKKEVIKLRKNFNAEERKDHNQSTPSRRIHKKGKKIKITNKHCSVST